ncbi:MAG: hypothetical protein K6E62_08445 [Lachnospiraceae bacterium]|nr:hypothetical protein [Lachnospiraceae bacterium]
MAKNGISKITRQLRLYDTVIGIKNGAIYGPSDLMDTFRISLRMLQRDLKDLRDSGLINLKYHKTSDRYLIAGSAVFDDTAGIRRKQHLMRLYRIGTLIHSLPSIDVNDFASFECGVQEFYIPDIEFYDLKAEYYALFPDSNERTRQRDFEEMCRAGFEIYYSRKCKSFVYLYPSNSF